MRVHVEMLWQPGDVHEALVDQDASLGLGCDVSGLVELEDCQHPRDGVEVLCPVVGSRRHHVCRSSHAAPVVGDRQVCDGLSYPGKRGSV